jgi:hypothetical protein
MRSSARLPSIATWLGVFGLVPFIGFAAGALFLTGDAAAAASHALLTYGATILSFLGGLYWGGALVKPGLSSGQIALFLGVGVMPQLLGWAALLVPSPYGHAMTAAGLLALLALDRAAARAGLTPDWFLRLRWILSCGAALAMLTGAFALLMRF